MIGRLQYLRRLRLRRAQTLACALALLILLLASGQALAQEGKGKAHAAPPRQLEAAADATACYLPAAQQQYPSIVGSQLDSCDLCHKAGAIPAVNNYGYDFRYSAHNFSQIERWDSDGDNYRSIDEIKALSFPGNRASTPDNTGAPTPVAPTAVPAATAVPPTQAAAPGVVDTTGAAAVTAVASTCYLPAAEAKYPSIRGTRLDSCDLCHKPGAIPAVNNYGYDFGYSSHNFATVESWDSDADGYRSITEIQALTMPGNKASFPGAGTAPTATRTAAPAATRLAAPTATRTVAPTATRTGAPTATRTVAPTATRTVAPTATGTAPQQPAGLWHSFSWKTGVLEVVEHWNAPEWAKLEYATNPWPRARLAAERAYVLAASRVLGSWNLGGEPKVYGAEVDGGSSGSHHDWPPHVHIFNVLRDATNNWLSLNSHMYPDDSGKITEHFLIRSVCGATQSYRSPADTWVDQPNADCSTAWQQRFTSAGAIELRRSSTAAVFNLSVTAINGDLATVTILQNGQRWQVVEVSEYDPYWFKMSARYYNGTGALTATESWRGDPAAGKTLTTHAYTPVAAQPTAAPTAAPTTAPTATARPTSVATATPRPTTAPNGADYGADACAVHPAARPTGHVLCVAEWQRRQSRAARARRGGRWRRRERAHGPASWSTCGQGSIASSSGRPTRARLPPRSPSPPTRGRPWSWTVPGSRLAGRVWSTSPGART